MGTLLSGKRIALPTLLLPLLLPLLCLAAPGGQRKTPRISVEVKAVTVYATVRDKHGRIVTNLDKDDFALAQDGQPQTIEYFARESDLPLTLGLLADTSLSQRNVLDQERSASYSFLDQMLREKKDQAFLIHFDREVELLQDLTSSRQKLQSALALLHTPQLERRRQGGGGGGPQQGGGEWPPQDGGEWPRQGGGRGGRRGRGFHGPGTLLYDAIYLASNDVMNRQHGRKALIILSDGVDIGSQESLRQAIEAAQRANMIVYSILFTDEGAYGPRGGSGGWGMGRRGGGFPGRFPREKRPDGKKVLEQISCETGGRLFQVSKKLSIDAIYAQIQEELRNQYRLTYTPKPNPGPGSHKIRLTTKRKGLIVQAREGYYWQR